MKFPAFFCMGCVMVLFAGGRLCQAQNGPQRLDETRILREMAALRADMRVLQEDQKYLLARISSLEEANRAKEAQVKELQTLLAAMDNRFEAVDKDWRARMDMLSSSMDADRLQRRKELENVSNAMAQEIIRVERTAASNRRVAPPAPPMPTGPVVEITVQRGDTLSQIAQVAGVSVQSIKKLNGMQNDTLFVGQKLKVPTKQ